MCLVTPRQPVYAQPERPLARLEPAPGIYFGVNLDWGNDNPQAFINRLGLRPAVYVSFTHFPLTDDDATNLDQFAGEVGAQHGIGLLTLEPTVPLDEVTQELAQDLADRLARYNAAGVPLVVRFAHEMNGSWYSWSQDPVAYVAAFRRLAEAVHRTAPDTAMLWAPNYGGGYPFKRGAFAAVVGSAAYAALDTNHDGVVDGLDDPYAPYYPGDTAVDWVGMTIYHWGDHWPWGANVVPEPGKFVAQISGTYVGSAGDERNVPNFYADYAVAHGKPMAIPETSALYNPAVDGAAETEIKRQWWRQVFSLGMIEKFQAIKMINWFEWRKPESEVGGAVVDWMLSADPVRAAAFRGSAARLFPVRPRGELKFRISSSDSHSRSVNARCGRGWRLGQRRPPTACGGCARR